MKAHAVQKSPSPPRRAIVYEDKEGSGNRLAAMLRKAGYEVLATPDFEPVLRALESTNPPELLVACLFTPPGHVNGLAVSRMARLRCLDLKVVYVSGCELPDIGVELRWPLLRKPVSEDVLFAAVRGVMNGAC